MSTESDLALLTQARTAVLTAMATYAGRPDYSVDGQSIQWSSLFNQLAAINAQISALQGPVEMITEGETGT